MSVCIYHKKHFNITKLTKNSFMVINTDKKFDIAHTHSNNYYICKNIIISCLNGTIDRKFRHNKRFIESVIRVCDNNYKDKFKLLLEQENREDTI